MLGALRRGFDGLGSNWGLVVVVFVVNATLALLLALPLAAQLKSTLAHTGASASMMYGFDYGSWAHWHEGRDGFAASFTPAVFGIGFAFSNMDLLLSGFVGRLSPLLLGLGVLYLVVQNFLTGGMLGVFRAPQGGWTLRGLLHGSGFYFGRLMRVSLLAVGLVAIVFGANAPLARWVDGLAREAVSEQTALALLIGRQVLLLLAILFVHMVASFSRVIVVREERQSAVLAFVSGLGFCRRNLAAVTGQYLVVLLLALGLLGMWAWVDGRLLVLGWKSQLVAFAFFQVFLLLRIALRLGLLASQVELHREPRGRG